MYLPHTLGIIVIRNQSISGINMRCKHFHQNMEFLRCNPKVRRHSLSSQHSFIAISKCYYTFSMVLNIFYRYCWKSNPIYIISIFLLRNRSIWGHYKQYMFSHYKMGSVMNNSWLQPRPIQPIFLEYRYSSS